MQPPQSLAKEDGKAQHSFQQASQPAVSQQNKTEMNAAVAAMKERKAKEYVDNQQRDAAAATARSAGTPEAMTKLDEASKKAHVSKEAAKKAEAAAQDLSRKR